MRQEFNIKALIELISIKRRFVTIFVIGTVALFLIYSFIAPYKYEAQTKLMPPSQSESSMGLGSFLQSFSGADIVMGGLGQGTQVQLYIGILKSRAVAKYVYDSLELDKHKFFKDEDSEGIYKILNDNLTVQIEKSGIISITYESSSPWFSNSEEKEEAAKLSAKIANKAAEALNHIIKTKNTSKARQTRLYIERSLDEYKMKLDSIEKTLEKFKVEHKILSLDEQTQAILSQAVSVGTELTKAEIEYNIALKEYDVNSPQVRTLKEGLESIQSQYEKVQSGGLILNDAFSVPLEKVPMLERIYTSLFRDQKIMTQVIFYLETQRHQEAIQEEKDVPVVVQLDEAIVPQNRVSPQRGFLVILSLFLSLIFSIGIVVVIAAAKGSIYLKKIDK